MMLSYIKFVVFLNVFLALIRSPWERNQSKIMPGSDDKKALEGKGMVAKASLALA